MTVQTLRLFVSSPGDVAGERRRIDLVVERLNAEFAGRVRIETVRWELSYYSAHETFQRQIPEAAECDVVVAVFRGRLGTPLPAAFPTLPSGEPYPSGTAYEILSAMEVRRAGKRVPDVYVFRYPNAPSVELDAPDRADIETQWQRLKGFFDTWFRTQSGEFLAAFQTYVSTDEFATKVEDCLRQWLAQRGYLAQGPVWDRVLLGSPFPGLAAFDAARGRVFFGRDLALGQAVERLRMAEAARVPFLLVIGASGSGKSSLLRAGLLPRLVLPGTIPEVDLWRMAVMMPGAEPFASLAEALFADAALGAELRAGTFRTREMLARQLAGDPEIAVAPVRDALERAAARRQQEAGFDAPRPARLALGIDQAERLFTEAPPAASEKLAGLLAALVRTGLATVVMVLRSDAYAAFQGSEALVALREEGATLDLVAPSAGELEEIVARPVAACHPALAFEQRDGRSLAALLVADAKGGDALPLLQVSLARLYAAEAGRGDGLLRFADYRGMDAAVTQTADEALATLDAAARAELPALVAGLVADVTTDPRSGVPMPVATALDRHAFEAGRPARASLVDAFVTHRLLTSEGDEGRPLVRPVHEALLRIWPAAVAIVAETASLIRVRHSLAPLVRAWSEATDRSGHLELSPALLDGAQGLLARFGDDLSPATRDFIAQAAAADEARRGREREAQERRIRDVEALAAARRRTARRSLAGLVVAMLLAMLAGWQWHDAGAQRDRAQRSLNLATQTANGLVFDLADKFRNIIGVPAATIKDILDRARGLQDQLQASGETSPALRRSQANALVETSRTLLALGDTAGALEAAEQARTILQALLTTQPDDFDTQRDLAISQNTVGDALQTRGDLPAALASFQAAHLVAERLTKADPDTAQWQHDLAISDNKIGDARRAEGDLAGALTSYQASLSRTERLAHAFPGDASWQRGLSICDDKIGGVRQAEGDLAGALASYRASLAIKERLAASDPVNAELQRDVSVSNDEVGSVQVAQGDLAGALASYQASLATAARLAATDPGNIGWQNDVSISYERIGDVHRLQGDLGGALASYQAMLAIDEALANTDPGNAAWQRNLSISHDRAGDLRESQGNLTGALQDYEASLAIRQRLAGADPANAMSQRDLSISHDRVGDVQQVRGDLAGALVNYRAALAIRQRLAAADTANAVAQRDVALSDDKIAEILKAQGDLAAALTSYQAAFDTRKHASDANPDDIGALHDLLISYGDIGEVSGARHDLAGALANHQAALAIAERLTKLDPGNAGWQRDLAVALNMVGGVQQSQGALTAALVNYQRSLQIVERLVKLAPDDTQWQRDLAISHERIGGIQRMQGDLDGAGASYQESFAIAERLASADSGNAVLQRGLSISHNRIGDMQLAQGDLAGALTHYQAARDIAERLAQLDPHNTEWQRDLSISYEKVGGVQQLRLDMAGALASYQASLAIRDRLAAADPTNSTWQRDRVVAENRIGDVKRALADLSGALASYQAALQIAEGLARAEPADLGHQRDVAYTLNRIAGLQQAQGNLAGALTNYEAALAIVDRAAATHSDSPQWQRDLLFSHTMIGDVKRAQGDAQGARASYRSALAIAARLAEGKPPLPFLQQVTSQLAKKIDDLRGSP